jgi:glutathione synthase/RimK-type ligase-like ATP-grasp enzyme
MILIAGIPSESPVRLVIEAAEEANIDYVLFNQRETHLNEFNFELQHNKIIGHILIGGNSYQLSDFAGIYVRFMEHRFTPEIGRKTFHRISPEEEHKSIQIHDMMLQWFDVAECRVMNRVVDMASNMSKPYQAQFIIDSGLKTPITLVTNSIESVKQFNNKHPRTIYKSISSIRSIVTEFDIKQISQLQKLRFLPTQFQELLLGTDIRVHVVGDAIFATAICSEVVDYRYASRENKEVQMQSIELPKNIENKCFELSKRLNLPLCGIDLKHTPDDEYYCFEVNPSPGYSYFQENTNQNIALAIVKFLEYGTTKLCKS